MKNEKQGKIRVKSTNRKWLNIISNWLNPN